jgi:glyoxylase-like metal-dependent hydrolase (beta-lactamase superfamily II)/rhodanese-related sulfurtransferase
MTSTNLMIEMDTLRVWLEQGRPVLILDVRPAEERAEWAIPGSIHVDAYDALKAGDPQALASIEVSGDVPVITICGAGKTSLIAAEQLQARGALAHSLKGGMQAWSLAWNAAEVTLAGSAARVIQVRRTAMGCLSYLIGADGNAVVIDPSLPPDVYRDLARRQGWRITHVLETHLHADHLSRGRVLAEQSGAALLLPAGHRVAAPFTPLTDGETIAIGTARLRVLHTPGHTPESSCYLLDDAALFTGDTLFLSAVGRPDLHASHAGAREKAMSLYRSLQRLVQLESDVLVLPGHTGEPIPFNGQPVAASLGEVRASLPLIRESEASFVDTILARIPPTPPNHKQIIALNEAGKFPDGDLTTLEAGANRCAVA